MKRLALILFAALLLVGQAPQPARAGNLALYIKLHNWSARGAWVTFYSCGFLGCDIDWAKEASPNRQGSGQSSSFGALVGSGQKFKIRIEITKPDGQRVDRTIEASASGQHWNACVHSDYTFTWC